MAELRKAEAEIFKALAHPTRILIIDSLKDGELSVNELSNILGLQGSNVSQQLAILRANNLVNTRKDGNVVFYSIKDSNVLKMLSICRKFFSNTINSFKVQLAQVLYFIYSAAECFSDIEFIELACCI